MTHATARSLEWMQASLTLVFAAVKDGRVRAVSQAPAVPDWARHLRTMDDALARHDGAAAVRAHDDAHAAVLLAQSWDGMLAVGAATLRLAPRGASQSGARADARRMYLWALVRARGAGSLAGVLRAGEAFAALGDRHLVALSARIAETLSVAHGSGDVPTTTCAVPTGGAIR
jgi:hypothetical protein